MLEEQIEYLKRELNHLIGKGYNFSEVYEISLKLDKLILQYYNERKTKSN